MSIDTPRLTALPPVGPWIQTADGIAFSLSNPRPEDVVIEDIAIALSRTARFGGHTRKFYSVAQHSCLAFDLCPQHRLAALLHDAAEAYIGDIVKPLKDGLALLPAIENKILAAIFTRFGIPSEHPLCREIKAIDASLLLTERRDLMRPSPYRWTVEAPLLPITIEPWSMERSLTEYLARFEAVYKGCM